MAMSTYTVDDVRKHTSSEDCWLVIDGSVLDITNFLKQHPGGKDILIKLGGSDATLAFNNVGHSDNAHNLKNKFCIGSVFQQNDTVAIENPTVLQDTASSKLPVSRHPIWKGNFTIYFLICVVISVMFTVGRGVISLVRGRIPNGIDTEHKMNALLALHLANALITSWSMMWNLFHTPDHGPIYRTIHRWNGRLNFLTGWVSTIVGVLAVWVFQTAGPPMMNAGFSIGITIGGLLQVYFQTRGVYLIVVRKNVEGHNQCMTISFFGGCCVPAIMRLPAMLGVLNFPQWNFFAFIFPLILGYLSLRALKNNRIY